MKIKRKRVIDILGVKHKIKYRKFTDGNAGFYSCADKEIEIDKDTTEKEAYLNDLIHECLHGVLDLAGVSEDITLTQEHCIINSTLTFLFANFNIELKK